MRRFLVTVLVVLTAPAALAGGRVLALADGAAPAKATIGDVAFIAGEWSGEALGGRVREVWTAPAAGAMVGLFRLDRDDALVFSELLHIAEEAGTLVLRLKHFEPDLASWEEDGPAEARPLVRLAPGTAYFDGLTFERVDADTLEVVVLMGQADALRELVFTYHRSAQEPPAPPAPEPPIPPTR